MNDDDNTPLKSAQQTITQLTRERDEARTQGGETFRIACDWQERAKRAEALLGEAVKLATAIRDASELAGITTSGPLSKMARSFLSSLSHQDEQG